MFLRFAWPSALAVALGQVDWLTIQLDPLFRSEGVAVGDVNRDGRLDILAGEVWYEAPTWQRHDLAPPGVYDPINGYSDCFVAAAADVDQDGWVDLLSVGFPGGEARWYRNPQGAPGYWAKHAIAPSLSNESPQFVDVDGDGRIDLLEAIESPPRVAWLEVGADPTKRWTAHPISNAGQPGSGQFYHGLGFGDVDGDGRRDALTPEGWYESPSDPRTGPWPFHPASLMGQSPYGPQMAAQIHAYDFDGDGDADLATSSPHAYGMWWWERTGAAPGAFTEHRIADWFSQSHALALADIDGDGLADLLSGKRWYAHGPTGDPGSQEPAVLVWFRLVRAGGQVRFERHLIDANSGVGTQFLAVDVNADGWLDVVTSNKKGVFLHLRRP
jgi:hypothetical protein